MVNFTCEQPDTDPRYNLTNICMTIWELSTTVTLVPLLCSTYILVLFTLIRDRYKEYSNPFYTFIVFDGICDLCMMSFSVYSFVYDLYGYSYLGGEEIDSFFGYIFYWALGWYGTEIFAFVITTNRLAAIIANTFYNQYFGVKAARIICLVTFVLALILVIPNYAMFGFHYVPRYKVSLTIRPKIPSAYLNFFTQFDSILTYTISIYVLIAYLIMCCYLYKNYSQLNVINPDYKKEVIFFVLGVFLASMLCLINSFHWYLSQYNGAMNRLGNIFYVGLNPIFCLILDSTLRREILTILKLKIDDHVQPIV